MLGIIITIILLIGGFIGFKFVAKYFKSHSDSVVSDNFNSAKEEEKVINELKKNDPDTNIANLNNPDIQSAINQIGKSGIFSRIKKGIIDKIRGMDVHGGNRRTNKNTPGRNRRSNNSGIKTESDTSEGSNQHISNTTSGEGNCKRQKNRDIDRDDRESENGDNGLANSSGGGLDSGLNNGNIRGPQIIYTLKNVFKDFKISQFFGERPEFYQPKYKAHPGIDYGLYVGTPLKAVFPGRIGIIDFDSKGYGYYIMLWSQAMQLYAIYGHLSMFKVEQDENVVAGQDICLSGNTGKSSGPHVHFALLPGTESGGVAYPDNGYKGHVDPKGKNIKWIEWLTFVK